jgi:hypothetical protein
LLILKAVETATDLSPCLKPGACVSFFGQITKLRSDRQLVSIVTSRASERPSRDRFISTEVCQQLFRGNPQIYLNEVETTTVYQHFGSAVPITADQITAVYLSPQDPSYFKAGERPVALYRYRLEFEAVNR